MSFFATLPSLVCVRCSQQFQREPQAKYCWPCMDKTMKEREKAYLAVRRAVREGQLPAIESQYCVDCGAFAEVYDHRDYSAQTSVAPVCRRCNIRRGPANYPRAA